MRRSPAGTRVTWALLGGAVAGAAASLLTPLSASILLGWDVAVLIYLAWTWGAVQGLDPEVTAQLAKREDPSTPVADLVIVGAGTAMLAAVGFALVKAGEVFETDDHGWEVASQSEGGLVLTFVTVASELSATVVLYSGPWTTMTVAMFQALEGTSAGVAAAAATVLIICTILPVALVYRLLRRHELSML